MKTPNKPTGRAPNVGRLDSLPRCRRELVRIYRDARAGRMIWQDATKAAHVVASIARLIEAGELEHRVERLERLTSEDLAAMTDDEVTAAYAARTRGGLQ